MLSIPFTPVFGSAPHARVLDYLLESEERDHTISGIARGAAVARPTVYKVVDDLMDVGLVSETRTMGNARFYGLNARSRAVKELARVSPLVGRRAGRRSP